jgi:hypothetical protein
MSSHIHLPSLQLRVCLQLYAVPNCQRPKTQSPVTRTAIRVGIHHIVVQPVFDAAESIPMKWTLHRSRYSNFNFQPSLPIVVDKPPTPTRQLPPPVPFARTRDPGPASAPRGRVRCGAPGLAWPHARGGRHAGVMRAAARPRAAAAVAAAAAAEGGFG